MGSSKKAVLKTLLYSDIFDFPLSKQEIWKFLISPRKENKQEIFKYLNLKNSFFNCKKNFYFIKGREEIIKKRREKESYSLAKIKFAQKIIQKLSKIPTVYFIGISGALAMKNSQKDDDIDLFIVTAKNSVWTTRLIIIFLLRILGVYRKRKDRKVSDKICLNMLIDETALSFPKERNDLYTAHEIVQILPVFNKNKTYEKLINSNIWIKDFLPNALSQKRKIPFEPKMSFINKAAEFLAKISAAEFLAKNIQFWYMKKHITNETILNNFLAFHPFDYKTYVLRSYKKKLSKYVLHSN